jgi:translation elongation factor EF-Tu-like GTPase
VHDELHLLPAEGPGTVKSLQVMDDDVEEAVAGDRVGIALRNTKEDHLTGGSLIIHPAVEDKNKGISIPLSLEKHEKSSLELSISPFQKRVWLSEMLYTLVSIYNSWLEGVESIDSGLEVTWESPLFIRKENPPTVIIAQLDSKA